MTKTKFISMSLKDLAEKYGVAGLEVDKMTYDGAEMPVFIHASPEDRKMILGGKIRYAIKDRFAFNASDPECKKNSDYSLYFYSNYPMNLKWKVVDGCVLYPYAGLPIRVIA